jgi:hypothetical protein
MHLKSPYLPYRYADIERREIDSRMKKSHDFMATTNSVETLPARTEFDFSQPIGRRLSDDSGQL